MSISTILFVCTGNTCRSPLAEGIAQKWLDEHGISNWLALSAGVYATEGSPTSVETLEALSALGIDFHGVSTPLTPEMAQKADIVLCMTETHLSAASMLTEKAELLDPLGDIADPIGQSQSVYDALADQLGKIIAQKLDLLTRQGAK
ncbi:MAG: hypothetical protein OR996_00600 [Phycisphaerales bacterium]|nr:hypothetical protein [Phycisphaerales bacterium]